MVVNDIVALGPHSVRLSSSSRWGHPVSAHKWWYCERHAVHVNMRMSGLGHLHWLPQQHSPATTMAPDIGRVGCTVARATYSYSCSVKGLTSHDSGLGHWGARAPCQGALLQAHAVGHAAAPRHRGTVVLLPKVPLRSSSHRCVIRCETRRH